MKTTDATTIHLTGAQLELLASMLAAEHAKLLVEIRHTDHRAYREELAQRLAVLEQLESQLPVE